MSARLSVVQLGDLLLAGACNVPFAAAAVTDDARRMRLHCIDLAADIVAMKDRFTRLFIYAVTQYCIASGGRSLAGVRVPNPSRQFGPVQTSDIDQLNLLLPVHLHLPLDNSDSARQHGLLLDLFKAATEPPMPHISKIPLELRLMQREQLEALGLRIKAMLSVLDALNIDSPTEDLFSKVESTLSDARGRYRVFVQQLVTATGLLEYHSPTQAGALSMFSGISQASSVGGFDYARAFTSVSRDLHNAAQSTFQSRDCGPGNPIDSAPSIVLTNSGMAGLAIALEFVGYLHGRASDRDSVDTNPYCRSDFAMLSGAYFEVDGLCERWARGRSTTCRPLDISMSPDQIVSSLRHRPPVALVVYSQSNSEFLEKFDVIRLVDLIAHDDCYGPAYYQRWSKDSELAELVPGRPIVIVDMTLMGDPNDRLRLFRAAGDKVHVIGFESLLKFGQDGLDLVQAGAIWTTDKQLIKQLEGVRTTLGFTPSHAAMRNLQIVNSADQRELAWRRHSRNAVAIKEILTTKGPGEGDKFLGRIHLPRFRDEPQKEAFFGDGPLLTSRIPSELTGPWLAAGTLLASEQDPSIETALKAVWLGFMARALSTAAASGVDLHVRTSFGNPTTSMTTYVELKRLSQIAITAGASLQAWRMQERYVEVPYLRIAAGTEPARTAATIGNVLARVACEVQAALKLGPESCGDLLFPHIRQHRLR